MATGMPDMTDRLAYLPPDDGKHRARTGRPFVTLSYAQSLDGCLTLRRGQSSPVSSAESLHITHQLRAAHDAILVGIGTVLADDPRLTARLVDGNNPQPVIVDSRLRTPLSARLVSRRAWIATTVQSDSAQWKNIEETGGQPVQLPATDEGRVNLGALLDWLGQRNVRQVMVEGGSEILTSFLREGLADRAVITVAPVVAGGYRAIGELGKTAWDQLPRLRDPQIERAGRDWIVWGDLV